MPRKSRSYLQRQQHLFQWLLCLSVLLVCCDNVAFAFTTSPPSSFKLRRRTASLHYSSPNADDNNVTGGKGGEQKQVQVAGVSVSPLGFLVILQSIINTEDNASNQTMMAMEVAFPIQLTSSGIDYNSKGVHVSNNNNTTSFAQKQQQQLSSLFQENIDQQSVTTPEALTFLQLLNGVDMATPILPPDTLSLLCVWYAFLSEEKSLLASSSKNEEELDDNLEEGGGGLLYEDELGLETKFTSSSQLIIDDDDDNDEAHKEGQGHERHDNKYSSALNYIRAMVKTTLPPNSTTSSRSNKDGTTPTTTDVNFLDASHWQRARVQLPRVWLHGVRMEWLDLGLFNDVDDNDDEDGGVIDEDSGGRENQLSSSSSLDIITVGRVPIKYTLECSVDDGLKRLEIPLFAIPSSYHYQTTKSSSSTSSLSSHLIQQIEISNEILEEISHNFNAETSASFMSLALYHRYSKSGGGTATRTGTTARVGEDSNSRPTLTANEELLNKLVQMQQTKRLQYCWPTSIRSIIQANGLPMYRPLHQIKEEDQRVLTRIFGEGGVTSSSSSSSSDGGESDGSTSLNKQPKKRALTLEQQALQQKLKSAWKIASQKGDSGALEKIRKAMEDLEKDLIIVEEEEDTSTLDKIQRAMRERDDAPRRIGEDEEEEVGLISDLEEATLWMKEISEEEDGQEEE